MRIVAKTASWSLTHMMVAIAVAYTLTRDLRAALAVGLIEPVFQTVAYALHERAWAKGWRRRRAAEAPETSGSGLSGMSAA